MLYAQAPGAIVVHVAVAVGLILTASQNAPVRTFGWWIAMLLVLLAARVMLAFLFQRAEKTSDPVDVVVGDPVGHNPQHWEYAYAILVVLSGVHLAAWSLFFFPGFPESDRLSGALILSAMAGGGIAILSMVRWLALTFGALLLLPAATMLIVVGGPDERVCGTLGYIYWFAMLFAVSRTHRRFMDSLVLLHHNALLAARMDQQSQALSDSNIQLAVAQLETQEANHVLEERIVQRTAELYRLATRDSLTGLANRTSLIELADACFAPDGPKMTLFFLDLDGFKEINDSMGHAVGDSVLYAVARRIEAAAASVVVISRWGGDEFVILRHSETDVENDLRFAELLIEAIGVAGSASDGAQAMPVSVDACVGIARFPEDGASLQDLIYGADMAVYAAKDSGRGKAYCFTDALADVGRRRAKIRAALALSLAGGCEELRLVYQPVFDSRSQEVVSLEALLRWHHSELGEISPSEFVPLAEKSGEIIAIGDWVLREACVFAANLDACLLPEICVNVSVRQLLHPDFIARTSMILSETGLTPERLVFELTESVFISDYEQISRVFEALETRGIKIAIDDFGTGYSSLAYLQRVPASTLKIDGSFVAAIDSGGWPIIEASISLARAFGMLVVAEGVETDAQLGALTLLGVDRIQGYLLGRPAPGDEIQRWLCGQDSMSRQLDFAQDN